VKKTKTAGLIFFIGGLVLCLVSLFADYIGLGDVDPDHFTVGSKQITGMMFGAAGSIAGIFLWLKK
jgi:hypothetical protein